MTQYRGYYIDHVIFNSKADIDEFIKKETLAKYKKYCEMFAKNPSMELSALMTDVIKVLREQGVSYAEIEQIELANL